MFLKQKNPIKIRHVDPKKPIIPIERWSIINNCLHKTYNFISQNSRNEFIRCLLEYEEKNKHLANITISENCIKLSIMTKNIDVVTELDKEYAKFADIVFKDVACIRD